MVALNRIGAIVTDDGQFDITIVDAILTSRDAFAHRAMDAGKQLSWETWRPAWTTAIESLCSFGLANQIEIRLTFSCDDASVD